MTQRPRIENGIVYSAHLSADIPEISVYACMKMCLQPHGDKVAAIEGDTRVTFQEFLNGVERYAAGFQSLGIGRGDRVCVHLSNKLEHLIAMYGIVAAGGTVVCAKPSLTARELLYQISDSDAEFALTDSRNAEKVAEVSAKHTFKGLFSMDDTPGFVSVHEFRHLPGSRFKEVETINPREEIVAVIYTSGTTGLPKGVEITHYGYVANLTTAVPRSGHEMDDITLAWFPITHMSGFVYTMICLKLGTTCVVTEPRLSLREFVETVNKHKVSSVFFFPTVLRAFVDEMERTGMRTPSVKKITFGGSALPSSTARKALKVFDLVTFQSSYSLTEACGLVCDTPPGVIAYDTIGFPGPMVQIKVVDAETGEVLGPYERGEMVVKLPNVMKGYYKKPSATEAVLSPDGWLRTGDCGYYDETGQFYFVERIKQMIKCLDNQVPPAELEEILLSHRAVAEAAVVGIPDPKYGEAPAAYVVLEQRHRDDRERLKEELKGLVARQCAEHKHLYGGVRFVEQLPKTETGKVQRSALRDLRGQE